MSDYLWDKRGEPDAEVARLEALLGAYRHEPRPLNLPAADATPGPEPARLLPFRPRLFAPAALAAAAALVVASVLIASVFLRARHPATPAAVLVMLNFPSDAPGPKAETPTADGMVKDEKVEENKFKVEGLPRTGLRRKGVQVVLASRRRRLPAVETTAGGGSTLERMSTPGVAATLVENARLLTKEQLVYALRFTGAKLKDVREKAQKAEARP